MVTLDGGGLLARRTVPVSGVGRPTKTDMVGLTMVTAGCAALCVPIVVGLCAGWSLWTVLVLLLSPVPFDAFWHYEAHLVETRRAPLLRPSLFRRGLH